MALADASFLDSRERGGAYLRAKLSGGAELLFCGHHWAEKRSIIGDVFDVQDDTGTITKARDKQ